MRKGLKLVSLVLCLAVLLLAVGLLASCSPGGGGDCTHRDADDDQQCDYCFEKYDDGPDSCTHRDADDDQLCDYCFEKFSDGPEQPDGPGGGGGQGSGDEPIDVTKIKADNFYISVKCDASDISAATDWYLGSFTEGLFFVDVEIMLCYGDGSVSDENMLEEGFSYLPLTTDSDRVTADMTFYVTDEALGDLKSDWLDSVSRRDFEDAIEDLAEDVFNVSSIKNDDLDKILDEVFGYSDFEALVAAYAEDGLTVGTSEELELTEIGTRDPIGVTVYPEGDYDSDGSFLLDGTIALDSLDREDLELGEYYVPSSDSYEMAYIDFDASEYLDLLEEAGLTLSEGGIVTDRSFFDVLKVDYANEKLGIVIELCAECPDGSEQPVELFVQLHSPRIYYTLEMPASVSAPLCFENNSVTYSFEVVAGGVPVSITYTTSAGRINFMNIQDQLPEFFRSVLVRPVSEESCVTETVIAEPLSVVMYVADVPVSMYDAISVMEDNAYFVFTYEGGYTTTLNSENNDCHGVTYQRMLEATKVLDTDTDIVSYISNSSLFASDIPYNFECEAYIEDEDITFEVGTSIEIIPVYTGVEVDYESSQKIKMSYYTGDAAYVEAGGTVQVMIRRQFGAASEVGDTLPLTADMIVGLDTSIADDGSYTRYLYVKVGNAVSKGYIYNVKVDVITSIEVDIPWFSTYVIGTSPDLTDATITAYYESGKTVSDIPLTLEHLSELPTVTGVHELVVTYEGMTDTHAIDALKVTSASVYSGLASKYLVGEKPTEVLIRVEFEPNHLDFDYDIIELSAEELSAFDTTVAGAGSWSYSFAGASVHHSYEVISEAYLVYMIGETSLKIQGIYYDRDEIPTDSGYVKLTSLSTLEIPVAIDGTPVTEIMTGAFRDMNMISRLVLPDSITAIGNYAFRGMTALEAINIPVGATVGTQILYGCTALKDLTIPGDYAYSTYFGNSYPTDITLRIAEGSVTACVDFFTDIGEATIAKVVIPSTLTGFAFDSDSELYWELSYWSHIGCFEAAAGGYFTASDGVLFADYGKILYYYPESKTTENYRIPDGVQAVNYMAYNPYLKSVVIPATVTVLGEQVFRLSEALQSVTFEGSLSALPNGCFDGCESLVDFSFPEGVNSIGDNCFGSTAIKTIAVPDTVMYIGYNAFWMAKVEKLAIPSSAMASFLQLGEQEMHYLAEFAYDGSVGLADINAIKYNFGRYPQNLNKIYIYGTESFESGVTGNTARTMSVYVDKSVGSITYGWTESTGTKYYLEASSITGAGNVSVGGYNVTFSKWYLG